MNDLAVARARLNRCFKETAAAFSISQNALFELASITGRLDRFNQDMYEIKRALAEVAHREQAELDQIKQRIKQQQEKNQ